MDSVDQMITLTSADHDVAAADPSHVAGPDREDLVITDNSDLGAYEAAVGGRTAAGLVYKKAGRRVTLLATSVLPEFRGKGLAARLTGAVLDELRRQGMTATIACPFAAAFVDAHPEYADVVDAASPGRNTALPSKTRGGRTR